MGYIELLVVWWVSFRIKLRVIFVAAELGIKDEGWASKYHPQCGTTFRKGQTRFFQKPVQWCYKCRDYWVNDQDDDDDDPRRRSKWPRPRGDEPEDLSLAERELRRIMYEKDRVP